MERNGHPEGSKNGAVSSLLQQLDEQIGVTYSNALLQASSQRYRNSISMIENQFTKGHNDMDRYLEQQTERHRSDLKLTMDQYTQVNEKLLSDVREREDLISHLQGRLDECRTARNVAVQELNETKRKYELRITELKRYIQESEEKLKVLQQKIENNNCESEKVQTLQETLEKTTFELKQARDDLFVCECTLTRKDDQVQALENEKLNMETQLQTYKDENAKLRQQLAECIEKSQSKSEDSAATQILKDQLAQLEKEYTQAITQANYEKIKLTKKESELMDVRMKKIDLTVEVRELKRTAAELRSKLNGKDEQCKELQEKLSTLEAQHAALTTQMQALDGDKKELECKIQAKENDYDCLLEIKKDLQEQKEQLEQEKLKLKNQISEMKGQVQDYQAVKAVLAEKEKLLQGKITELDVKKSQLLEAVTGLKTFMDLADQLERDLNKATAELSKVEANLMDSKTINQLLEKENLDIREQLRLVKIELNDAKSLKAFTEKRLERTETTMRTESQLKESEVHAIREKLAVASNRNEELSQELSTLTTQASKLESEKFQLRKELESTKIEKDRARSEMSQMVKTFIDSQEENSRLKAKVNEAISRGDSYKHRWEEAMNSRLMLEEEAKRTETLLNAQIEQQKKAMDLMVEKISYYEKKKKFGIFTPRRNEKELFTPSRTPVTPRVHVKERILKHSNAVHPRPLSPVLLEQERLDVAELEKKSQDLRIKLHDLKSNNTPLSKKTPTLPAPRKEENILLKERSNTIGGTPGKFVTGRSHSVQDGSCVSVKKCMACFEPIHKARPMSECENCKYTFHMACARTAGETCGLSEKKAYEIEKDISLKKFKPITNDTETDYRGIVKVRAEGMPHAEKRLLVIEDNKLKMYANEADRKIATPAAIFPLNEETTILLRVDKRSNPSAQHDEMTWAMKVIFNEDEEEAYLYMFHSNKEQKRYWTRGILRTRTDFSDSSFSGDENKENQPLKLNEKLLVNQRERIFVNCAYYLSSSQTYLLGCDDGLYSVKNVTAKPVKIAGPTEIYAITVLPAAKLGLFIEGSDRVLSTAYSGLLKTCAEAAECSNPKLTTQVVPHTKNCLMFAMRSETFEDTTVAVACHHSLLLCTMKDGDLSVVKKFLLKEDITSLLMTPQTILYGTDVVYELDKKTFQNEEFLDSTDDSIYYVQVINEAHGSYPVEILDVTESQGPDATEVEYLICYNDIAIFVDSYGRRTRDGDVLWSHVPFAFEYRHPYLYIIHQSSVEVQKLDARSYTRRTSRDRPLSESKVIIPETKFVHYNSKVAPYLLGEGARGVVVAINDIEAVKVNELFPSS